jgi:membrane protein
MRPSGVEQKGSRPPPDGQRLTLRRFFAALRARLGAHDTAGSAAQLAYYLVLSVFPFLFFVVTLLAFLPLGDAVEDLMDRLSEVMPDQAMKLISDHLHQLLGQTRPKLLTAGLLAALWTASRGADALRKGLNRAYEVEESRSFWRVNAAEILLTVVGTVLVLAATAMVVLGGKAGELIADHLNIERQWALIWGWLRWPATGLVVMLTSSLAYHFLPDVKRRFKLITAGSAASSAAWLFATWGFTQYAENFGNYNATYGSIGGVIVLMTWLYISGLIFLVGGEINAVIERASPEGRERGARAPGGQESVNWTGPSVDRPSGDAHAGA